VHETDPLIRGEIKGTVQVWILVIECRDTGIEHVVEKIMRQQGIGDDKKNRNHEGKANRMHLPCVPVEIPVEQEKKANDRHENRPCDIAPIVTDIHHGITERDPNGMPEKRDIGINEDERKH